MNKWISSLALSLLAVSLACPPRALGVTLDDDLYGAAVVGGSSSMPSATLMSDPNGFGDQSIGYVIAATTTPSCFAGVDWPTSIGSAKLSGASTGTGAPNSVSFLFQVPRGSLDRTSPANPNLTIVIQDSNGDYFYAGKNQGIVPNFKNTNSPAKTADQFILKAAKADFVQANSPAKAMKVLTRVALVWSGWNTLGGSANITSMYVTGATITNNGNNMNPRGYMPSTDSTFNFN